MNSRRAHSTACPPRRPNLAQRVVGFLGTLPVLLIAAAPAAIVIQGPLVASAASDCNYQGRWYGTATSGAGSNTGTGASTTTWTNWSVPGGYPGFSDEGVWSINNNNHGNALEGGFFTGTGSGGYYTNAMSPYYTTNNGANEVDGRGQNLGAHTGIWMATTDNGSTGSVTVGPFGWSNIAYGVSTPRLNYAQGEVNCHDIWMGGGSGESFQMYFLSGGSWNLWGYNNNTYNWPYWVQHQSNSSWANGGYGYA